MERARFKATGAQEAGPFCNAHTQFGMRRDRAVFDTAPTSAACRLTLIASHLASRARNALCSFNRFVSEHS